MDTFLLSWFILKWMLPTELQSNEKDIVSQMQRVGHQWTMMKLRESCIFKWHRSVHFLKLLLFATHGSRRVLFSIQFHIPGHEAAQGSHLDEWVCFGLCSRVSVGLVVTYHETVKNAYWYLGKYSLYLESGHISYISAFNLWYLKGKCFRF